MSRAPRMSVEEARASLERLREMTREAGSTQPAPPSWITSLHDALAVVATHDAQQLYRLDGVYGVTMEYLHNRVLDVLRDFDHLAADNLRPRDPPQ